MAFWSAVPGKPPMIVKRILLLAAVFFATLMAVPVAGQSLYIFYPSIVRPMVLQKMITDLYPGLTVVVFGRFQDFMDKTASDKPDVVITKPQVLPSIAGYKPRMDGIKNGQREEPYVLLSINKGIVADSIPKIVIGTIDILGRKGTEDFVAKLLGQPAKINRVTKIEDLLPMITFSNVQAILVEEGYAGYFRKNSNIKFVETHAPGWLSGIAVCAAPGGESSEAIVQLVKKLPPEVLTILDISQWGPE
jgi:hypothetical protein